MLSLAAITLVAAIINGALGYGFSSITVPLALLFIINRVLNPALVVVEVFLNLVTLIVNRRSVKAVWPRLKMILLGIIPAILIGSYFVKSVDPTWVKLCTYITLLPLLFLQVAGIRRPVRMEGPPGAVVGGAVGILYSLTTISGPPLALLLNNEGMAKSEFRAALGVVRVFESVLTAIAYYWFGMISAESLSLIPSIVPSIVIGIPIGAFLIRSMNADVFRRVCMSFDVLIVSFGLARALQDLKIWSGPSAYLVIAATGALDLYLLSKFFQTRSVRNSGN